MADTDLEKAEAIIHHLSFEGEIYNMDEITYQVAKAIATEREACMRDVCDGCRKSLPIEDMDGDLMHDSTSEEINPQTGRRYFNTCEAWAIRDRAKTADSR